MDDSFTLLIFAIITVEVHDAKPNIADDLRAHDSPGFLDLGIGTGMGPDTDTG